MDGTVEQTGARRRAAFGADISRATPSTWTSSPARARYTLRKTNERYLGELLCPPETGRDASASATACFAEAHNRLSQPLYCLAFAMIALAAILRGRAPARRAGDAADHGRRWRRRRLRIAGYGVVGLAPGHPALLALFYLIPLLGAAGAMAGADGLQPQRDPGARARPRGRRARMSWSWTLYRYLALQFLLGVAVVYAGFLALAFSIDIVDLLNRTAGHDVATADGRSAWRCCSCPIWARRCCPSPSCWAASSPLCGCRAARNWWRRAPPAFRPGISCCRRWPWRCSSASSP